MLGQQLSLEPLHSWASASFLKWTLSNCRDRSNFGG